MNHKFHYDSIKQTNKWLALHQAYSPSRTDPDCEAVYDKAFAAAADLEQSRGAYVIGLGCGGGQKDTRLLNVLKGAGREVCYTPSDVSVAMTLVARETALNATDASRCFPLVCDLSTADDLAPVLDSNPDPDNSTRILTFFGMIPNFEPSIILPKLTSLLREDDLLLFSANLAPGPDYAKGIEKIVPLYDNALTRDWLMTALNDVGIENSAGELKFFIADDPKGGPLKRVEARFQFSKRTEVTVYGEQFVFTPGEEFRLFFSYRHTPALVKEILAQHGMQVVQQWITHSEEEGVFLVRARA